MTKDRYVTPELEIIAFDTEDIITTSAISLTDGGTGVPEEIGYSDLFN